jgi:hypothetical protein
VRVVDSAQQLSATVDIVDPSLTGNVAGESRPPTSTSQHASNACRLLLRRLSDVVASCCLCTENSFFSSAQDLSTVTLEHLRSGLAAKRELIETTRPI